MFDTNFFSAAELIQKVVKIMKENNTPGRIVNTSSIAGILSIPYMSYYSATKYAVNAMSDALRLEKEKDNIKVVRVEPGTIKTNFDKELEEDYNNQTTKITHQDYTDLWSSAPTTHKTYVGKIFYKAGFKKRPKFSYYIKSRTIIHLTRFVSVKLKHKFLKLDIMKK